MKANCIQTMLIDSSKNLLNPMKAKCIQSKIIDSNKSYWIKWKQSSFKQS